MYRKSLLRPAGWVAAHVHRFLPDWDVSTLVRSFLLFVRYLSCWPRSLLRPLPYWSISNAPWKWDEVVPRFEEFYRSLRRDYVPSDHCVRFRQAKWLLMSTAFALWAAKSRPAPESHRSTTRIASFPVLSVLWKSFPIAWVHFTLLFTAEVQVHILAERRLSRFFIDRWDSKEF